MKRDRYGDFGLPYRLNAGSSGDVSGWSWSRPSHRAADDFDGSASAGSDNLPFGLGGTTMVPATSVGTMVINDELFHPHN